jgi:hypothetical protein
MTARRCSACGNQISKVTSEVNDGLCTSCYFADHHTRGKVYFVRDEDMMQAGEDKFGGGLDTWDF